MFRCVFAPLLALVLSTSALAQAQRSFPPDALRGSLVFGQLPEVTLNGQPARLGAGARVRDPANLQPRPSALIGMQFLVHYTVDTQGLVKDVWILTPDEAARKPWPATVTEMQAWQFDPVAQTWTKP